MDEFPIVTMIIGIVLGWWGGNRYYGHKYLLRHTQTLRSAYCKGLNYLLSERTDEAIETFADLISQDVETIETHLALGNLFRRQGEVEKAIEIHEKLACRSNLSEEQRSSAQFELGLDYLRLGLYDRAEMMFVNLLDRSSHRRSCLELLLHIYQQEKDWQKAIKCVAELNRAAVQTPRGESESQFLCELALEAISNREFLVAEGFLIDALKKAPNCLRATLLRVDLLIDDGQYDSALMVLNRAELSNSPYTPEILSRFIRCHVLLETPKVHVVSYLEELYGKSPQDQLAINLADQIASLTGDEAALAYLVKATRGNPSLRILHALVCRAMGQTSFPTDSRAIWGLFADALGRILQVQPRYRCNQCGFSGQELHWRCPSCRHWESTIPVL